MSTLMEKPLERRVDEAIGRALRIEREARMWTRSDVALAMTRGGFPWTHQTVGMIERAERSLKAAELLRLAFVLDVSPLRLVDDAEYVATQVPVVEDGRAVITETDERFARRLRVSAEVVQDIAHQLWGQSVTVERDNRTAARLTGCANRRSVQAIRGHVSRDLYAEIDAAIASREEKA